MKIWESVVLGLIQGVSEFLPISSSGHLLLFERLGVGEENLFFNVCLHLGTLLAVLIAMRKSLTPLVRHPFQKTNLYLLIASIPTVAIAMLFKAFLPSLIDGDYLAVGFMITACLLLGCEKLCFAQNRTLSIKTSISTGFMQGIAVLPGISRSGSTIACMRLLGVDKDSAAEFSFLLSIPIIIGSAIVEGVDVFYNSVALESVGVAQIIVGAVTAFISGFLSIKFFLKMLKSKSLIGFAVYTAILGIVTLIIQFTL